MQPRSRLSTVLAATGLTLALAACSSSTSPKPPTPHALASHFDSIASSLLAQGTDEDSMIGEIVAIAAVAPPAYGSPQASFTVTTGSGTATWHGYTIELATTGSSGDSTFATLAFSDNNLSQLIFAVSSYNACGPEGGMAIALAGLNTSTGGDDSTFTGSAGLVSQGNACPALQSGLATAFIIDEVTEEASACAQATFNVTFNATFPTSANLGPLSTISVSNVTFDGIRFSAPEGPSHVAPIPSRVAALAQRLRNMRLVHTTR